MPSPPPTNDELMVCTPLEYARSHGLSLNYLTEKPERSHMNLILDTTYLDVEDDALLPQFDFGTELSTIERLTVPKEAAILLVSITKEEVVDRIASTIGLLLEHPRIKRLRLEEPLLRGNNETDRAEFVSRVGFETQLRDIKLPLESVNDESNEGTQWPLRYEELNAELIEQMRREKIRIPKEALVFLQDLSTATWTADDEHTLRTTELKYKKKAVLEPVTPPLSPRESHTKPSRPSFSSPTMEIPIFSDPAWLVAEELAALEASMFTQDLPTPIRKMKEGAGVHHTANTKGLETMTVKLSDIYSPLATTDSFISFPDNTRIKYEDLKVEEPLSPPELPTSLPKSVHFSDTIEDMLLDLSNPESGDLLEDKFFEEAFGGAAERANRMAQQERLLEADSVSRVTVPSLSFDLPDPPWKELQTFAGSPSALVAKHNAFIADTIGDKLSKWPGVSSLLRVLPWVPFSNGLGKVTFDDDAFADATVWEVLVQDADENIIAKSSQLTWKSPGLKIVMERSDEEDEDDVEPGVFEDGAKDVSYLVKKRRINQGECVDEVLDIAPQAYAKRFTSFVPSTPTDSLANDAIRQRSDFVSARSVLENNLKKSATSSLLGGAFSIGNSLDNYIELRGGKKQKLMSSNYFPTKDLLTVVKAVVSNQEPQRQAITAKAMETPKLPQQESTPLQVPPFDVPTTPINIIVSSFLLKNRSLMKHLKSHLPTLNMVERDFTAHNKTTWLPGSVSRSPIASPMASEADLIISSLTGVIITTLQKIKQKPLPGKKVKSAIQERLEKASTRYEKLIVLVGDTAAEGLTSRLDESDCLAISEFIGFTLGSNTSITVYFAGGGDEILAKWLAAIIIHNATVGEMAPLEDETHWELFLRRAGMNAFAAQIIIASLKAPDGVDTSSPTKAGLFGMAAFVEMTKDGRISMFGQSCGERILERVSALIDERWE